MEASPETPNPHPEGSDEAAMWEAGRLRTAAILYGRSLEAVMRWASDSLTTVQELAKGYGQGEISQKLETVIKKLREYSE